MVDFTTWMSIGMEQCAPSGPGTQAQRRAVFSELAEGWNRQKDEIKDMTATEVRQELVCP